MQRGAQPRNQNARKHGGYARQQPHGGATQRQASPGSAQKPQSGPLTISALIKDLVARQMEILTYAQKAADEGNQEAAIRAMAVYGQNASRLARMLERAGSGQQDLTAALHDALDRAQEVIEKELMHA